MSLSTRRNSACRWTSSATSLGWLDSAMAGAGEASTTDFLGAPNGSASGGHMGVPRLTQVRTDPNPFRLPVEGLWVYGPYVDFTAHQGPMALQRLKDQGG